MKDFFLRLRHAKWLPIACMIILLVSNAVTGYLAVVGGHVPPDGPSTSTTAVSDPQLSLVQDRLARLEDRIDARPTITAQDHWSVRLVQYGEVGLVLLGLVAAWLWIGRPVVGHVLTKIGIRHPSPYDMA